MSTRPIKADFYSNARAFTSHLSKRRNRNSPFQSNHMTLLWAMFLLPLLASFAKGQLPRSDQAVSCDGKIEERERPAAPISMNTSKPDEMMLCDDSFENEAKERDGFAARQPWSLSSNRMRSVLRKQWITTHTSTREDSTSKVVYCQFFFRNP